MQTINITPKELKDILKEYEYDPDVMNGEDERVHAIKYAISKLEEADRIIWCLYLDIGSSRKLGKLLGVSHSTILKETQRIREIIKTYVN